MSAVQWLCEDVEERFGLKVDLVDDGRPKTLDERTGTTIFRSLRELLINVSKHAGVSEARVELQRTRGQLQITVSDRGAGFEPVSTPRGFGLSSAHERMDHLGGSLSVHSEPGRGTRARLSVPLRPASTGRPA